MTNSDILFTINSGLDLLAPSFRSKEAMLLMAAIGLQESKFLERRQLITKNGKLVPEGPAVSFWQFEEGNPISKGGVWGVLSHFRVGPIAKAVCAKLGVSPTASAVWKAMRTNDALGAAMARLLIYADPQTLPTIGDSESAWDLYANRAWRPGKPHKATWAANYARAREIVGA